MPETNIEPLSLIEALTLAIIGQPILRTGLIIYIQNLATIIFAQYRNEDTVEYEDACDQLIALAEEIRRRSNE